jgi:uncharacterized membrane protein
VTTAAPEREEPVFLEPRWPIVATLGFFITISIVLRIAVPDRSSLGPVWLVPAVEVGLVLVLLAADPARVSGHRRRLRRLAIGLVSLLACAALASTVQLIVDLVEGTKVTNSASALLASGALIWLGNVLVFSLFYWLLDSGGPLARYRGDHPYPDFAFTQHMSPELSPPGWRTQYADYLILALTTSTAFSPTDVMPMARWAKLTMSLQALIALTVVGLVIARAVNVFA